MLDNALDWGLTEEQFWNMTIGELDRYVSSRQRQVKAEAKQKATFDYTLALLIGKAVRGADEEHPFPELYEIYPDLFLEEHISTQRAREEAESKRKAELSALRFIQFAESFNQKFDAKEANE